MSSTLKLSILTPEKELYTGEIKELIVETETGSLGILPEHIDVISTLRPALTTFIEVNGKKKEVFTSTGILHVQQNQIKILCDAAEWPEDIDLNRAAEAKKRAEERLQGLHQKDGIDTKRAELALMRSMTRLKIKGL